MPRSDSPISCAWATSALPACWSHQNRLSFVERKNVIIEYRWANFRYERLSAMAADLAQRSVADNGPVGQSAAQARPRNSLISPASWRRSKAAISLVRRSMSTAGVRLWCDVMTQSGHSRNSSLVLPRTQVATSRRINLHLIDAPKRRLGLSWRRRPITRVL
jgi:hypothetical protein